MRFVGGLDVRDKRAAPVDGPALDGKVIGRVAVEVQVTQRLDMGEAGHVVMGVGRHDQLGRRDLRNLVGAGADRFGVRERCGVVDALPDVRGHDVRCARDVIDVGVGG